MDDIPRNMCWLDDSIANQVDTGTTVPFKLTQVHNNGLITIKIIPGLMEQINIKKSISLHQMGKSKRCSQQVVRPFSNGKPWILRPDETVCNGCHKQVPIIVRQCKTYNLVSKFHMALNSLLVRPDRQGYNKKNYNLDKFLHDYCKILLVRPARQSKGPIMEIR